MAAKVSQVRMPADMPQIGGRVDGRTSSRNLSRFQPL
jgi:hypothetical protein